MRIFHYTKWCLLLCLFWVGSHLGFSNTFHLLSSADSSVNPPVSAGGDSYAPIMTEDGMHILFTSAAGNLCLSTNGQAFSASVSGGLNVFVRGRTNGVSSLASVNTNGTAFGNADSLGSAISTNGQFALFESKASDLVIDDTNGVEDIFVRDLLNQVTIRASVGADGGNANGPSWAADFSSDGRYVAFVSSASNLVPADTNGIPDVFVRDTFLNSTVLISAGASAANASSLSEAPRISADGKFVAFQSTATNLISGVETTGEIYVRDIQAGTTVLASAVAQAQLNAVLQSTNAAISFNHLISADGRFIAYQVRRQGIFHPAIVLRFDREKGETELIHTNAYSPNSPTSEIRNMSMTQNGGTIAFIANAGGTTVGTNTCIQVWCCAGTLTLASGNMAGVVPPDSTCDWPALDRTGRYLAFVSNADGLVTNSLTHGYHIYVRDLALNSTVLVNMSTSGRPADELGASAPQLSGDGRFIAFQARDGAFVQGDHNDAYDVFLRDRVNRETELISARAAELPSRSAFGHSIVGPTSVSSSGRYVAFVSSAERLVTNDFNGKRDIFLRDHLDETTTLVSVNTNGVSANGTSLDPSISGNGRYVAFASTGSDLAEKGPDKVWNVFVRDLLSQTVTLASVAQTGTSGGNHDSFTPQLNIDGSRLLFRSRASNLVTVSSGTNLFYRDLNTSTTRALTSHGVVSESMSQDGRYVAFVGNLGAGNYLYVWDANASARVYTNTQASLSAVSISPGGDSLAFVAGSQLYTANWRTRVSTPVGPFTGPAHGQLQFSGDGKYLTFATFASQSLISDTNANIDTYLLDIGTGVKTHISKRYDGLGAGNDASSDPVISYDGRFVAYRSLASNLVQNTVNYWPGIFLYDRITGTNKFLTAGVNDWTLKPSMSGNGRFLVFSSASSGLARNDFSMGSDLFGFAFLYATVTQGSDGRPVISWPTMPGESYGVQFKDSVTDPGWTTLGGKIFVNGAEASITDEAPANSQRIYRVVSF